MPKTVFLLTSKTVFAFSEEELVQHLLPDNSNLTKLNHYAEAEPLPKDDAEAVTAANSANEAVANSDSNPRSTH